MAPFNGHVVVQSVVDMSTIKYKSLTLLVDTSFEPENHQEVINEVIKLPEKLYYDEHSWECKIEVELGDLVFIEYMACLKATILDVEGDIYRLVPYNFFYLAKRGDQVIPLNGNILVSPIYLKYDGAINIDHVEVPPDCYKIEYMGKPVDCYKDAKWVDMPVQVGDYVVMRVGPKSMRPFERGVTKHFDPDKTLFVVKPNRIIYSVTIPE